MTLRRFRLSSALILAFLLLLALIAAQQAPKVSAPYEMILHKDVGSAREQFGRTVFAHLFDTSCWKARSM